MTFRARGTNGNDKKATLLSTDRDAASLTVGLISCSHGFYAMDARLSSMTAGNPWGASVDDDN